MPPLHLTCMAGWKPEQTLKAIPKFKRQEIQLAASCCEVTAPAAESQPSLLKYSWVGVGVASGGVRHLYSLYSSTEVGISPRVPDKYLKFGRKFSFHIDLLFPVKILLI